MAIRRQQSLDCGVANVQFPLFLAGFGFKRAKITVATGKVDWFVFHYRFQLSHRGSRAWLITRCWFTTVLAAMVIPKHSVNKCVTRRLLKR
jgi:hypothetical protein